MGIVKEAVPISNAGLIAGKAILRGFAHGNRRELSVSRLDTNIKRLGKSRRIPESLPWITVKKVKGRAHVKRLIETEHIGVGEAEAIRLAKELRK